MARLRGVTTRRNHTFYLALLERHAPAPAVNVADLAAISGGELAVGELLAGVDKRSGHRQLRHLAARAENTAPAIYRVKILSPRRRRNHLRGGFFIHSSKGIAPRHEHDRWREPVSLRVRGLPDHIRVILHQLRGQRPPLDRTAGIALRVRTHQNQRCFHCAASIASRSCQIQIEDFLRPRQQHEFHHSPLGPHQVAAVHLAYLAAVAARSADKLQPRHALQLGLELRRELRPKGIAVEHVSRPSARPLKKHIDGFLLRRAWQRLYLDI